MNDLATITAFLATLAPFDTLDAETLQAAAGRMEAAYYPRGAAILESGPRSGLAVIRKGAVRLLDEAGRFLDKRSEGEVFGPDFSADGRAGSYRAEAEEDTLLWHLPEAHFGALTRDYPRFTEYFTRPARERLGAAARPEKAPRCVRDVCARPPVCMDGGQPVAEAARLMSSEKVSSVLVLQGDSLAGIVTDIDLRERVLAPGLDPGTALRQVMTANPAVLGAEADLDAALLLMLRHDCHHLPIVEQGKPVGLVTSGDLLRAQSEHPLRLVRDIHRQGSVDALAALSGRLPALFLRLVEMGRDARHTGRLLTSLCDAFTTRLIRLAEERLGPAPLRYAWAAFGSQAREEQGIRTDQDNGLLLERDPDPAEGQYFAGLADFVCRGLDRLGYEFCPGEIMALNPRWRVSAERWKRYFDGWTDEPEPRAVMHSSIFFDMRCIAGDAALVRDLSEHAVQQARDNGIFLRFMAANVLEHRPPIGFFRRFVQESDGSHSEGLNLKHRGIVPIIDLVRLRALESGIPDPGTYRRLEQVVAAGAMNPGDADSLRDALNLVGRLRLEGQARQLRNGEAPGNHLPPEELSPLMRRNLKAAFGVVMDARRALASRYPTA